MNHLNTLMNAKQFEEARKFAPRLDDAVSLTGSNAYLVGCLNARLASQASDDSQREMEIARAMEWLRKAESTGDPATPKDVEHIRTVDDDLKIQRSRPEFQEWAKALKAKK